jgi:hypothetical protein
MLKSKVQLVNTLKEKLGEYPSIVNSMEHKDSSFIRKLLSWLMETEEIFATYNISEVSELSGLRSKIISARFSEKPGTGMKKQQLKIASETLYEIQKTVLAVLKPNELKLEESRELVRQLLQIISQTKAIQYNSNLPFGNLIADIWSFIISNDQLKAGAVKLKTNLSVSDIHLLFAEEIDLNDF